MIVKLKEVYRESTSLENPASKMLYRTREILVNSEHVAFLRENKKLNTAIFESTSTIGENRAFCTIMFTSSHSNYHTEITVVGSLNEVSESLSLSSKKVILHG